MYKTWLNKPNKIIVWIGKVVTQYHPEELLEIAEREESIYLKDLAPKKLLPKIQWVVLHPNIYWQQ